MFEPMKFLRMEISRIFFFVFFFFFFFYDGVGVCVYDGSSGYDGVGGCGFFFIYFNFHTFTKF